MDLRQQEKKILLVSITSFLFRNEVKNACLKKNQFKIFQRKKKNLLKKPKRISPPRKSIFKKLWACGFFAFSLPLNLVVSPPGPRSVGWENIGVNYEVFCVRSRKVQKVQNASLWKAHRLKKRKEYRGIKAWSRRNQGAVSHSLTQLYPY